MLLATAEEIRKRLLKVYGGLVAQLETEEKQWLEAQLSGLETPTPAADESAGDRLVNQFEQLLEFLSKA
jgi:hypothetical protein